MVKVYRVVFTKMEDGWYVVTVPGVCGALTQARSIEQGLERIRETLALFVDDAHEAALLPDVQSA